MVAWRTGSVFIMSVPPETAVLVPAFGSAIEPLVHSPESVETSGISGVGVINDPVLERERAHAGTFADVGIDVGTGSGCEFGRSFGSGARERGRFAAGFDRRLAAIVVLDSLALLFFGERDVEIIIEIAAER